MNANQAKKFLEDYKLLTNKDEKVKMSDALKEQISKEYAGKDRYIQLLNQIRLCCSVGRGDLLFRNIDDKPLMVEYHNFLKNLGYDILTIDDPNFTYAVSWAT